MTDHHINNGDLFEKMIAILQQKTDIPADASIQMVIAGVVLLFQNQQKLALRVRTIEERKPDCVTCQETIIKKVREVESHEHDKMVKWSWLLEKLLQPALMVIIAALVAIAMQRIFGG